MSQKWWFDPKWRIKIRFLDVTLRVSIIFSIFFLHSSGIKIRRKFCGKKVFQKIQDGGSKEFFHSKKFGRNRRTHGSGLGNDWVYSQIFTLFLKMMNFASFQNGGYAQNGWQKFIF
jgi:hypothetical protein